ncbi:Hydrogenobyrinic acid ac-diamide synthase cobyrinate ac-diamide synthase [Profundibacterium mesophilum KAUST100406-0324]|uniref:Hydrogenobyrinate a,c-diamide synthase n=1 Tax=Profundibacterium mesophilum KAUST100406-0324 TaxID=1037889 RepID=A0A921NY48_9RHOB|nr:Hydrogenobyrinic acid ac-diamide synthase cobyrinate ac-diamide synthase [Profundibacterium mesophilum KAUST100406-0324]
MIIAAPASGAGKTTLTLGLLRALRNRGIAVRGAKSGPDYIDPRFHAAASGAACVNLDAFAMPPNRIIARASGPGLLLIEGAMGLFDGAPPDGRGAAADLARILALPVILVVDAARMAQSVLPLVEGFARHDPSVRIAGIILNRCGSERHAGMLTRALAPAGIPVLGALLRQESIAHPSRHLGLVQAEERADLDLYLEDAARHAQAAIDLDALCAIAAPLPPCPNPAAPSPPPAQRIAVAQDRAFAFHYPHLLGDWHRAGAQVMPFSPLADEAPDRDADLVYLPGGYPELHAGRLAAAQRFLGGLRMAAERAAIFGECGGYMVLGHGLIDADGVRHEMAGLLDLETSFARRRLHLGYRLLETARGPFAGRWAGHEFHYATTLRAEGTPLFEARDAAGDPLAPMGLSRGMVQGSFAHLIDRRE